MIFKDYGALAESKLAIHPLGILRQIQWFDRNAESDCQLESLLVGKRRDRQSISVVP